MRYLFLFSFLIVFTSPFVLAASNDSVKVMVIDEKEVPVSDVRVTIDGNPTFVTNKSGIFSFNPSKKLVLPFVVTIIKKGYELDEFSYYENEKEIELRIKKSVSVSNEFSIHAISPDKLPIATVHIIYNGKNYTTDKSGNIKIPEKKFTENLLSVKGFKIDEIKASKDKLAYTIQLSSALLDKPLDKNVDPLPKPSVSTSSDTVIAKIIEPTTTQQETEEIVFKQYQQDFDNLSLDIVAERTRLIESNKKIRAEIERLTGNLKSEKNLSPEKRQQLRSNIEKLEKTLIENSIAYNKAEEKTLGLIQDLKMMVMHKDSINAITVKMLQAEQKKRVSVEKKAKRTLILFTIITISLVILGIAFYTIARKMRSQRTALLKSNEELMKLKEQYEQGVKAHN
jgi:hypothetical protein